MTKDTDTDTDIDEQQYPQWQTAKAVTGRPNDTVEGEVHNSTFASRAKARRPQQAKQVNKAEADDKNVGRNAGPGAMDMHSKAPEIKE